MTKQELRKMLRLPEVEKWEIKNEIGGFWDWKENFKVFIPHTDSHIWSNWKVCISLKHSNYMWFKIWLNSEHEFVVIFDYVWKAGPGKKMRGDAAFNLYYQMSEKIKN